MAFEIRKVKESDFDNLFELFGKRKKKELLRWVYGHPCADGLSAYIAVENEKIIGAVGFVRSAYFIDGEIKKGLIPLSWEVARENRGIVGVKLLFTALRDADFYLGMDGSEDMKQIFKGLNFKKVGEGVGVKKVLMPFKYLKTLKKVGPRDILRFFTDFFTQNFTSNKSSLEIIQKENYQTVNLTELDNMVYNTISAEHVEWLSKNPGMTMYLFETVINGYNYAPIILFSKEMKNGIKRGQIVHIPPLKKDDEKYYKALIVSIEQFFKKNKITAATALVTNPSLKKAFADLNYRFDKKPRPIVAKGSKDIMGKLNGADIHLSYAESDKSVRNI